MTLAKSVGLAPWCASRPRGSLDQRRQRSRPSAGASGSATSGRRSIGAGRIRRRRRTGGRILLHPARAQILVGEIVHVLEDRKLRHQARRQRRASCLVGIDRAELLLEKAPKRLFCPLSRRSLRRIEFTLRHANGETASRPKAPINLQESKPTDVAFLQTQALPDPRNYLKKSGDFG